MDKGFFAKLFDQADPASSMRFAMVFSYLFVSTIPFIVWAAVCIMKQTVVDIPAGVVGLIVAVLGIATAGKVTQSILGEGKDK